MTRHGSLPEVSASCYVDSSQFWSRRGEHVPEAALISRVEARRDIVHQQQVGLAGQRPRAVYATARWLSRSRFQEPEYVQLHLGFANGGMALIDHAQTLPPGEGYYSLSLIGSKGAAMPSVCRSSSFCSETAYESTP